MKAYPWILGILLLALGAAPVRAEEAVQNPEPGYIVEAPSETGKDVFIQIGKEDQTLSEVLLTVAENGREMQVAGEAIANVAAFHLPEEAELIRAEGLLDGEAFLSQLGELDSQEGIRISGEEETAGEYEAVEEYIVTDAEENPQAIRQALEETGQPPSAIQSLSEEGEDGERVVVIDPGHGPDSPGTCKTWDGILYREEIINLEIAEYLKEELETYANVQVYLTRDGETTPTLKERVEYAAELDADILVSIHLNAAGDDNEQETTASGVEAMVAKIGTYNPENAEEGQALARSILDELVELGFEDRGFVIRMGDEPEDVYEDGSVSDYYGIVRYGQILDVPSIIVEHGFLNNQEDFRNHLSTPEARRELAEADARGIANYLDLYQVAPWEETLIGDWDGDGIDTLCGRIGNTYYFKDSLSGGEADRVIAYGREADRVLAGDWGGDASDTLAVWRDTRYYFKNTIEGGEADMSFLYGERI